MPRRFQGKIELDVRNSQADWPAFLAGEHSITLEWKLAAAPVGD